MKNLRSLACALLLCALPAFASVTVTSPKSGSTVSSPVSYVATATTTCSKGVSSMGVYVNNQLIQKEKGASLNLSIALSPGTYSNTVVEEWDLCGGATYTKVPITVSGTSPKSGVTVTAPAPNSTVASPVSYAATATSTCAQGVSSMGLYVNNKLIYTQKGAALSTSINLAAGAEHTVVEEWDHCGGAAYT
ncbi:MAG: Ig-like domain-containing protein, partial [Acidobacteriaceae bacterium]